MSEAGGGASRSTEPATGSSAATDVSLREHLAQRLHETERRLDERYHDLREADWRFSQERDLRYREQREADRRFDQAQRESLLLAQGLQREVDREHFAHLNESAARSIEERGHFATREALEALKESVADLREEVAARLDRELGEREGQRSSREGLRLNTAWLVGVIGALAVIANLYISTR